MSIVSKYLKVASFFLLIAAVGLVGCEDSPTTPPVDDDLSIYDFVASDDNFSTLQAALDATGLDTTLDGDDEYTLFAPGNAAFEQYDFDALLDDEDLLSDILTYHVVSGAVLSTDLQDGQSIETVQGDELIVSISGDSVIVDGALVMTADITGPDNGVIHEVDDVLLENRSTTSRLQFTNESSTLFSALTDTGVREELDIMEDDFTIFAPTNAAFDQVDTSAFSDEELADILRYHAIPGDVRAADIQDGSSVQTFQGENLTFTLDDGNVFVNDTIQVTLPNRGTSQGVIHQVDGVLVPPSYSN